MTLAVLGWEIVALEVRRNDPTGLLVDDDTAHCAISGGSAHDFGRDLSPLSADGEEPWYGEDRFGFRA